MRAQLRTILLVTAIALGVVRGWGLDVTAKSAIVMDAQNSRVLWAKDADAARFPASTTKVMTALLLIERCGPDDIIVAPADSESVTGSSLHLRPGERVTAREMLYAMMLRSANDACHAVAVHISGSDAKFAELMNARAKELGCRNTRFHNPHGLNDPQHSVSARDLGIMACQAMRYPLFREVVRQRKHTIVRSLNQEDRLLVSHNKWLTCDSTADGIKTGYTVPAGHCYVGSAVRKGFRIITVLLASQNWQADHQALLDWAFKNHDEQLAARAGAEVGEARISGGLQTGVQAIVAEDVRVVKPIGHAAGLKERVELRGDLCAPITRNQVLGMMVFSDSDGWQRRVPLVAGASIAKASLVQRAGGGLWTFGLAGTLVAAGGYWMRRRLRTPKRSYGFARYR